MDPSRSPQQLRALLPHSCVPAVCEAWGHTRCAHGRSEKHMQNQCYPKGRTQGPGGPSGATRAGTEIELTGCGVRWDHCQAWGVTWASIV